MGRLILAGAGDRCERFHRLQRLGLTQPASRRGGEGFIGFVPRRSPAVAYSRGLGPNADRTEAPGGRNLYGALPVKRDSFAGGLLEGESDASMMFLGSAEGRFFVPA